MGQRIPEKEIAKFRLNKIAARWPAKAVAQFFYNLIKSSGNQVLQVVSLSRHNQQSNRIDIPTAYEKNTIELPFWQAVLLCYDEIADEIFKLREQREKCTVDTAARDAQIARINELQDFIKQQPAHLEAFDEALVKRWLERIIVWENHFTVELKSGLKIDIER